MRYRWWLAIAGGLFCIGIILGIAVLSGLSMTGVSEFLGEVFGSLEQLAANLAFYQFSTALFIFFNNLMTLLVGFIFSPILCLTPVVALLLNGGLLSLVSGLVLQEKSIWFVLAAILPHGIFEIPALIIGGAASLSFGVAVMLALVSPEKRGQLLSNLKQNLRYLVIAGILLVPAAIIETFITPLFLS